MERNFDRQGGRRFGGRGGNGGGGGRRFGGGGFNRGPREMHKATCADCGKECEVPFKPTEGRPVYCRDCFQKRRDGEESGNAKPAEKQEEKSEEQSSEETQEE